MVAFRQTENDEQRLRLTECLREAGVPGDTEDHDWIARKLMRCRNRMDPESAAPRLEDLLLSGFLLGLGLNPAACSRLEGACFPDTWLRAVPSLLRSGCPPQTWGLVRQGVVSYDGSPPGVAARWKIDGARLRPFLEEWHELGETLVFRNLARGLAPLMEGGAKDVQVALKGVELRAGRRWLRELRGALEPLMPGQPVHLVVG